MDVLDVRILRELTQSNSVYPARPGFGTSYRGIARSLSVSPGTIRNRVHRMTAGGVLTGSSVYANPNLLGLEVGAYALEVSPQRRKHEVVERLRALDGVCFIQNFRGGLLGIVVAYPDAPARKRMARAVHRITGGESGVFSRVSYPPCHVTLRWSEWKLLARLVRGPFSTYSALAGELGVSVRTVKRQVAKLVHARAVLSVPTMDYRALSGCVPADLLVAYASPAVRHEAERKVLGLVKDQMIFAGVWTDFGMYSLLLPKVSATTQIAEEVARIPGVAMSRLEIVEEHIDQVHALWTYVDRQVARLATSRGRPTAFAGNSLFAARTGGMSSFRGPL
jgi:DNA-binding Lrp family transcriptional regulator